jgi:hypothetical protein
MKPGEASAAGDYIEESLEPLEQMAQGETRDWIWGHIHTRCAGLYIVVQALSENNPTITNNYTEIGERHLLIAARYHSRDMQLDPRNSYWDTMQLANGMGGLYGQLADEQIAAGKDPLKQPQIESDLKFCERLNLGGL